MNAENHREDQTRPRVLLVSTTPILQRTLGRALGSEADVLAVDYGTDTYLAAHSAFPADVVVIDVTRLGDHCQGLASATAFTQRGAHRAILGYAHDEGAEIAISEEMNATFNPSVEGILELLRTPRRRRLPRDTTDVAGTAASHPSICSREAPPAAPSSFSATCVSGA
jgi:hypothetical protein